MSLSYNQSILVDCSQVKASTTNKTSWINTLPDAGINLNPQDSIQVYSAFINNKSSSDSIEITDNEEPLFYTDPSLSTNDPTGPETSIKENEVTLTFSFYKNATGANTIPMPYNFFLSSLQKNGIVMRDGYENCIVGGVNSSGEKTFGNIGQLTNNWYKFSQDIQNIIIGSGANTTEINGLTFAVNTNLLGTDPKLVVRLAALPTGNPQLQTDYQPSENNELDTVRVLKTYLGDLCQPLDGSRCIAYQFNPVNNKYEKFTKKIKIEIKEGSYSPSNLGEIITNQITLAEKDTGNVLDEDFNENGFYIKSPISDLDDALYISREKIENAKSSKINVRVGSSTSKFIGVYPQQSPLISRIVRENGTVINDYRKFTPTIDNYFELGKSDKTKTANSGTGETGFNYTGSRSNAFLWGMLGRNADDTGELYTRKTNVYYRYPETLERGQELVENFGLTTGINVGDFISFNYDVVTVGDSTLNPSSVTPNNSTVPGANYVKNRGDIGYIISNVPWTPENLKKFKRFFDSQLIEDNITNCFNFTFNSNANPTSRSQTKRGTLDNTTLPHTTQGNRWINIGVSNLRDSTNSGLTKGFTPLVNESGTKIYEQIATTGTSVRTQYSLMQFGSDYLGSDDRSNSLNIDYEFQENTDANTSNITQPVIGQTTINVDSSNANFENYYKIDTNIFALNGPYDIRSKQVERISTPQLISIQSNFVDRKGVTRPFQHPLPETPFFENLGYGYMTKYISNGRDPTTDVTEYIAFELNVNNTGGLQRDVLKYILDTNFATNGIFYNSQAIGWLPFFSSHGNQAIMSVTGQGTSIANSVDIDATDGDVDTTSYKSSIIQTGIGVSSNIPQLVFDDTVSRFSLQNFYTPVISSNIYGFTGLDTSGNPISGNPNAGNEILSYNVNNIFNHRVSTGFEVFNEVITDSTPTGSEPNPPIKANNFIILNSFNEVFPYSYLERIGQFRGEGKLSIYYQQTGVAFDKWIEVSYTTGVANTKIINIEENETNFNNSLWATKLGFSFEQTHNQIFTTDTDIKNDVYFTVNNFRNSATINQNGAVDNQKYYSIPVTNNTDLYNTQFDSLLYVNNKNFNQFLNNPANSVNSLEIISKTTEFLAANLPDRSSDPFFIIESTILQSGGVAQNYFSQDSLLNAVDIVQKSFNSNDFYMFNGGVTHTVTNPYSLNFVEHRIRRSNGNLLKTNKFSSIIYLINKRVVIGMTPEEIQEKEEIIEQNNKERNDKQKMLAELNKGKNLDNKQKLLKTILFQNILNRKEFDIPQTNQDNTLEDIEIEDQDEEQEEDLPELEGDEDNQEPINNTEQPVRELTVTLGRVIGGGILPDDEEEEPKNIKIDNMEKSVLLPEKLRAENLFKDNPDTRITTFPIFSDIKSASRIEKPKRIIKQKPKNPNELEERLSTRLSAMQRRPNPSRLEKPEPFFKQKEQEEQKPNIRKF